jgi:hypothetical protein
MIFYFYQEKNNSSSKTVETLDKDNYLKVFPNLSRHFKTTSQHLWSNSCLVLVYTYTLIFIAAKVATASSNEQGMQHLPIHLHLDNQSIISYRSLLKLTGENAATSKTALKRYYSVNPIPQFTVTKIPKAKDSPMMMAIIGDGVDYNHPQLMEKIHYTISKEGKIIGAGQDFIAQDVWPAPYIARTMDIDPDSPINVDSSSLTKGSDSDETSIKDSASGALRNEFLFYARITNIIQQYNNDKNDHKEIGKQEEKNKLEVNEAILTKPVSRLDKSFSLEPALNL